MPSRAHWTASGVERRRCPTPAWPARRRTPLCTPRPRRCCSSTRERERPGRVRCADQVQRAEDVLVPREPQRQVDVEVGATVGRVSGGDVGQRATQPIRGKTHASMATKAHTRLPATPASRRHVNTGIATIDAANMAHTSVWTSLMRRSAQRHPSRVRCSAFARSIAVTPAVSSTSSVAASRKRDRNAGVGTRHVSRRPNQR